MDSRGLLPKTMPWVLSDLWETRLQVLPWVSQAAQGLRICLSMQEMQELWVQSLDREDPLEKETATHSSILACEIPWTEEPGGLESMRSQRDGHSWEVEHAAGSVQNLLLYWPPIAMNRPVEDLKLFCFFFNSLIQSTSSFFFLINLNFFLKSLLNLLHYFFCIIFSGFFWPWCMWYLSSPVKDRTHTPCVRRQILNHRLPGRTPGHFLGGLSSSSLETQSSLWESICPD